MVAHHAPPSLGFSRQEHWSGLSFPSPMHESERWTWSCSVMSDLETPWTAAYQAPPSMARVLEWGAIAFSEWINKYVKKILKCMPECAVHCTKCLTFDFRALEKEMTTHSSVLAWRIPGMAEPGGLPSMGSHKVGHDWSDLATAAAGGYYEASS